VTDDAVLARPGFAAAARGVLAAGGGALALHLRGPRTGGRALHALAASLADAARAAGAMLVVADRVDVALAAGAGAVQVGARGLDPRDARAVAGARLRIGVSVHAASDVAAALAGAPDWLTVGTLYATPSHPGRPGAGPGLLRGFAGCGVPLVGIGGVTPARAGEVVRAGAAGVAILRGIWDAPEPAGAVRAYLRALAEASVG
jgi:thiamine-phosphate diphosphorylase